MELNTPLYSKANSFAKKELGSMEKSAMTVETSGWHDLHNQWQLNSPIRQKLYNTPQLKLQFRSGFMSTLSSQVQPT